MNQKVNNELPFGLFESPLEMDSPSRESVQGLEEKCKAGQEALAEARFACTQLKIWVRSILWSGVVISGNVWGPIRFPLNSFGVVLSLTACEGCELEFGCT
jgi:hypothetical protein